MEHFLDLPLNQLIILRTDGSIEKELSLNCPPVDFINDFIHPEDQEAALVAYQDVLAGKGIINLENRYLCKENSYKWFSWTICPLFKQNLIYLIAQEVTSKKVIEQELRDADEKITNILESITDAFFTLDNQWRFTYLNRETERLWKKTKEEILGKSIWNLFPELTESKIYKQYQNVMNFKTSVHFEAFLQRFGIWTEIHAYPYQDGLSIYFRDISMRKQIEEEFELLEERFSKAFNLSPSMVSINSYDDLQYIDINEAFESATEYSRGEIIGLTIWELDLFLDSRDYVQSLTQMFEGKKKIRNMEISFRTKCGKIRKGLFSADLIEINRKKCILTSINDVTEHEQLKQEISRLDRLNLIGQMAAGIGHEIRNPLTVIRGFLQMLLAKEKGPEHKRYYSLMITELDRCNTIITEFLSLAKNKPADLELNNLNNILNILYPLISADALNSNKNITFDLKKTRDLFINEKEIRQLILNLVRNGLEAMPSGGNLTIKTYQKNGEIILSVEDQGEEIKPEILEKLGTPFFTTKAEGTGLGLAVCHSIAARHNALINVKTSSTGTIFSVHFRVKQA